MDRYKIVKRVANTDDWKWTGMTAKTLAEAEHKASNTEGGKSTGAGYTDALAEFDGTPNGIVVVVGC
jgi:hypothetical protein